MQTWPELVTSHHSWAHADDGRDLVTGAPATSEELAEWEARLGIVFPTEFNELYRTYNGVGVRRSAGDKPKANEDATLNAAAKIHWLLVPLAKIPELAEAAREWFQETHAEASLGFLPFIDWGCGDCTGYLLPLEPCAQAELYTFEHESYEFDEAQEADEFLTPSYESIRDFFELR